MIELPRFDEFYRALHGRDPFPWQQRLAELVADAGWPAEIGVPTGLGKTSTIDIALWSLAAQADRPARERTAPTRVWYVVNRRLLVDAASTHAERVADLLAASENTDDAGSTPIGAIAVRLRAISPIALAGFDSAQGAAMHGPLYVSRLRGGAQPGRRPPHPAQPAIICTTVPMYGSRLLFRAYGTSNRLLPIEAAHAGVDSLLLLDEAHLAEPLQQLLADLPRRDANMAGALVPRFDRATQPGPLGLLPSARAYPTLVNLTATGTSQAGRFDLDESDRHHPVIVQRLRAAKPTDLVVTTRKSLGADLAARVSSLTDAVQAERGTSDVASVVFVNSPRTAREVSAHLQRTAPGRYSVKVLTGHLRGPEADAIRDELLGPAAGVASGRGESVRARPVIVVATQTLEVGADLDFDVCVSELAGVRAITQRLGRLNRLGARPWARACLFHVAGEKPGVLYGDEPDEIAQTLGRSTLPVDLPPGTIANTLPRPQVRVPNNLGFGVAPQLASVHLWEFAKTSAPPADAAPPEPFFDGYSDFDRTASVLWRSHPIISATPLVPPVSDEELIDVPIAEVESLAGAYVIDPRTSLLVAIDPGGIRPGTVVVVPSDSGGYGDAGWDPESKSPVLDLSPVLRNTIHVGRPAFENFLGVLDDEQLATLRDIEQHESETAEEAVDFPDTAVAQRLLSWLTAVERPPAVSSEAWTLPSATKPRFERDVGTGRLLLTWQTQRRRPREPRVDALDGLSLSDLDPNQRVLATHLESVGQLAHQIAESLGLPPSIVTAVADAARFHDLGKVHPRFQRWLGYASGEGQRFAKSDPAIRQATGRTPVGSGWPRGARHELLSCQILDQSGLDAGPHDALVRHLVITHHGHGRPLCPTSSAALAVVDVALGGLTAESARLDPGEADWCQPERFRALCEEHGYWGVALLEAILRQADHVISRADEVL